MNNKIEQILKEIKSFKVSSKEELEELRIKYLGKKGKITALFDEFKSFTTEEKKEFGVSLNNLKNSCLSSLKNFNDNSLNISKKSKVKEDKTLIFNNNLASKHPISLVKEEILSIFNKINFSVALDREIEDDYHVFESLNFPENHPARDMQDTFFISTIDKILLRTHTSSIQIRVMENKNIPIRVICPGRVFRNETISYRAHCIFHQVEGLYIDKKVSLVDLKQTLLYFCKQLFGDNSKIRLRPSYFPFTEPSFEVDVNCNLCNGEGCSVCKHTGWLEIMGAGMVDPNVLESSGIDSSIYSGYAFGMGIERITMLKYRVKDLRLYFENDVRFLNQFSSL